jgi:hypothetical protein
MFTVTFLSIETGLQTRASGVHTLRQARKLARLLSETFSQVTIWQGEPGAMRVS